MQATSTLSLIQRFYDAKGDPGTVEEVMSANVVWDIAPGFPYGGVYTGLTSVRTDFLAPLTAGFGSLGARPDSFTVDGEKVIVVGHYVGSAKTGEPFEARFLHVWTVSGGQIVHNYQVADSAVLVQNFQN